MPTMPCLKWAPSLTLLILLFLSLAHGQTDPESQTEENNEIRDYFDTITDDIFEIIHSKIANPENVHHSTPPKSPAKGLESFSEAFTRPRKLMNRVYWKSAVLNEMDMDESWKLGIYRNYSQITNLTVDDVDKWRLISKCLHSPIPSIQMISFWSDIRRHEQNPTLNATYRPYVKPNNASAIKFLLDLEYYPNASSVLSEKGMKTANTQLRESGSANNMILSQDKESKILSKLGSDTLESLNNELSTLFPTFNFTTSHFAHIAYRAVAAAHRKHINDNIRAYWNPVTNTITKSLTPSFPQILKTCNDVLKKLTKTLEKINANPTETRLLKSVYSIVFASHHIMTIPDRGQLVLFENGDLAFEIKHRPDNFVLGALHYQPIRDSYAGKIEIELEVSAPSPMNKQFAAIVKLPITKPGQNEQELLFADRMFASESILTSTNIEIKSAMLGKMGIAAVTSASVMVDKVHNVLPNERSNVLFSLRKAYTFERCLATP